MSYNLNIYRNAQVVATVSIGEELKLVKKLMNADKVTGTFISSKVLPLELGDYVTYKGRNYYLNSLPTIEKKDASTFKYTVIFQSPLYDLFSKMLISSDGLTEFSYVGNPLEFITLLVDSMNSLFNGWSVGAVDDGITKTIDFNNDSCRTALTKIADAFTFEFELNGKAIDFKEAIGTIQPYGFEYGKDNGLYSITRKGVENENLATRIYAFGGTSNIPYTYRNRAKRLIFEERYLEKNTDIYGVREGYYINDDIYPQRTSTLTDVNILIEDEAFDSDSYVEDDTLDFNINDFLAEGLTAKIVFKTGALSGSQFEIWKYDHDTKRIYFNPFIETDGYTLPNETQQPQIGDSYTLVDIDMPPSYIIQAEADLKDAAQKDLDERSVPKALYLVKLDPKRAKSLGVSLDAGDLVQITDSLLGIDRAIRVAQITLPLANPYKIDAIIADFIPYSLQEQIAKETVANSNVLNNINNIVNNAINNQNNTTNVVNNTTTVNEGNVNKIEINGRLFSWEKGFDNIGEGLEVGDVIFDNYWSRYLFVKKWKYLGGIKELRSSWDEIETLDETPII